MFLGVIFDSAAIPDESRTKNWLWNFLAEEAEAVLATLRRKGWSKMCFFRVVLSFLFISGQKMPKKPLWNFFGWKGGRCLSHILGSRVVHNAVLGGFTQFSIHFWPENTQKTTLKFLTFFVPDTLHSSEIVQNGFPRGYFWFGIHYWWKQ